MDDEWVEKEQEKKNHIKLRNSLQQNTFNKSSNRTKTREKKNVGMTIKTTTNSIIMYCNNFYWLESETAAYQMLAHRKLRLVCIADLPKNLLLYYNNTVSLCNFECTIAVQFSCVGCDSATQTAPGSLKNYLKMYIVLYLVLALRFILSLSLAAECNRLCRVGVSVSSSKSKTCGKKNAQIIIQ